MCFLIILGGKVNLLTTFFLLGTVAIHAAKFNFCASYFNSSTYEQTFQDMESVRKISWIEDARNWFRNKKSNNKIIEINRRYIQKLIALDDLLYSGKTEYVRQQYAGLFRDTELSYFKIEFKEQVLMALNGMGEEKLPLVWSYLHSQYEGVPFAGHMIADLQRQVKSVSELKFKLREEVRNEAKRLGKKFLEYKLVHKHFNNVKRSKACDLHCKKEIKLLLTSMGVGAADEQTTFTFLRGLRSPTVESVRQTMLSQPKAVETHLYQGLMAEIIALARDLLTFPRKKRTFVSFLYSKFPQKRKKIALLDKLLLDIDARTNHFAPINSVVQLDDLEDQAQQLSRLKSINTSFQDDELLVTFARQVDQRTQATWEALLQFSQAADTNFYERMIEAQAKANMKGDISALYRPGTARRVVEIALTLGAIEGARKKISKLKDLYLEHKDKLFERDANLPSEQSELVELQELSTLLLEGSIEFELRKITN